MLKIFNNLEPFFEDVFREISVREYGQLRWVSPPTASSILKELEKENLLLRKQRRIYLFFRANREFSLFQDLARAYWRSKLIKELEPLIKQTLYKKSILFGSISKVENSINSDIDLFISIPKREIDLKQIEKKLNRKIQIHFQDSLKNLNLKKNIGEGITIK